MSTIYLAHSPSKASETFEKWDWDKTPVNFLVSFYYLQDWQRKATEHEFLPIHTMLDSGAFTAFHAGKTIDIEALITESKRKVLGGDLLWNESVCLDVIGSAQASMKNSLYMKEKKSPAFPVFHLGEPWEILAEYCRQFPKVGIARRQRVQDKNNIELVNECFRRQWPHPFHLFGWMSKKILTKYPFHSADSTGWMYAHRSGHWGASLGGAQVKNSWNYSLRGEILEILKMERFLQARWKKELKRWPKIIKSIKTSTQSPIRKIV